MGEDEVRATLQQKGANPDCPACGLNDAWSYVLPGFATLALDTGFRPSVEVSALICDRCGYIRLHHYATLMGQAPPRIPDDPL